MVKTSQLAAAAAMLALAAAMPTQQKRSMKIAQGSQGRQGPSGQAAYVKALRKYGADEKHIGNVLIDPGSVTASSVAGDLEYLCPVTISGTEFQLDFDTGSSDLWIFGPDAGAQGHATYSPGSDAQELSGYSWKISYGDGSSASGNVYKDTVTIGQTVVTGQAVEVANQAADQFLQGESDGLVGIGFDSINTVKPQQQKTFISNAIDQGLKPVIACDLKKGAPGSYTFGDVPFSDITYTPIDSSGGWFSFSPDSAKIGGQEVSGSLSGIADTGTTLLLLGSDIVGAYWGQVQGASQTQGYEAVVPGDYMNYAVNSDNSCYGGLQEATGLPFGIYGDIFLKSQNVVFDYGNKQLGLGPKS